MHVRSLKFAAAALASFSLALVVACGGNASSPVMPTTPPAGGASATADVTVTIVGMNGSQSFSPEPVTMKVGQTVTWRNADSITHTATANGGAFNTGSIAPGATSSAITMNTPGTFAYHCSIHPEMTGTLVVTQ